MRRAVLAFALVLAASFPASAYAAASTTADGRQLLTSHGAAGKTGVQPSLPPSTFVPWVQFQDSSAAGDLEMWPAFKMTSSESGPVAQNTGFSVDATGFASGAATPTVTGAGYVFAMKSTQHFAWRYNPYPSGTPEWWFHPSVGSPVALHALYAADVKLLESKITASGSSGSYQAAPVVAVTNAISSLATPVDLAPVSPMEYADSVRLADSIGIARRRADGKFDLLIVQGAIYSGSSTGQGWTRYTLSGVTWDYVKSLWVTSSGANQYCPRALSSFNYSNAQSTDVLANTRHYIGHSAADAATSGELWNALSSLDASTVAGLMGDEVARVRQSGEFDEPGGGGGLTPDDMTDAIGDSPVGPLLPDWAEDAMAWLTEKFSSITEPVVGRFLWWWPMLEEEVAP